MTKERTKLNDNIELKLYRKGKLIQKVTSNKEDRLEKIIKKLLNLFGVEIR